jgi:plasmid stabilization system protein ParE
VSARFEFSADAKRDFREIGQYIALNLCDRPAARRWANDMEKACADLARIPSLGHRRKDLATRADLLFYCVRDYYLVIYQRGTDPLLIVRILHGAQDVASELSED